MSNNQRFADGMATEAHAKYEWEPITVTTEDDYILTLFHVWNPEVRDENKSPVHFQRGATGDATGWFFADSIAFYLADLGHDVYIGSNRGTEFS